jgi:hypothetical protein
MHKKYLGTKVCKFLIRIQKEYGFKKKFDNFIWIKNIFHLFEDDWKTILY